MLSFLCHRFAEVRSLDQSAHIFNVSSVAQQLSKKPGTTHISIRINLNTFFNCCQNSGYKVIAHCYSGFHFPFP